MSSGENVLKAFKVIDQTYANIKKMFDEFDEIAERNNACNIIGNNPRFLRWRSDMETEGWYLGSMIKLFQEKELIGDKNLWNEPIYVIDVVFWDSAYKDSPEVFLAKFEYKGTTLNGKEPGISDHWMFYQPITKKEHFKHEKKGSITISKPIDDKTAERFGNIEKVSYKSIKLMDITNETIEKVFKDLLSL